MSKFIPNEPVNEGKPDSTNFIGKLLQELKPVPPCGAVAKTTTTLPRDDMHFIAKYSTTAMTCASEIAQRKTCGCAKCKLAMFETQVSEFMCLETVAAAYTGDLSKLQAVLDLIAKLKAK